MELQIQSLLQEAEYIGDDGVVGGEGVGVAEDVKYLRKQYFLLNEDFQRPLRYRCRFLNALNMIIHLCTSQ